MISLAYKLISVKCPDCGQTLSIEENRTQAFCTYCGAKVLISNENEYVFRQVDEAGIQKAETERLIKLKELELQEQREMLLPAACQFVFPEQEYLLQRLSPERAVRNAAFMARKR